ncbi:decreased expression in renal and prostate cancer protein-like [Prinia subflava]|uniref:decreased expression in renal and prostate cancer protein-like n=1 Tax=Prinia subflava TaxID=208062 RepID=UPI002FE296D2
MEVDLQMDREEEMEVDGDEPGEEEMEVDVEEEKEEEMEVDVEEDIEYMEVYVKDEEEPMPPGSGPGSRAQLLFSPGCRRERPGQPSPAPLLSRLPQGAARAAEPSSSSLPAAAGSGPGSRAQLLFSPGCRRERPGQPSPAPLLSRLPQGAARAAEPSSSSLPAAAGSGPGSRAQLLFSPGCRRERPGQPSPAPLLPGCRRGTRGALAPQGWPQAGSDRGVGKKASTRLLSRQGFEIFAAAARQEPHEHRRPGQASTLSCQQMELPEHQPFLSLRKELQLLSLQSGVQGPQLSQFGRQVPCRQDDKAA